MPMFPNRRIHGLVLYLLAAAVAAPHAGTQSARPAKQYTMEQFLNTTSITGATFSRDESRILFSSNKSGIWNAYTVSPAGGPWTQVTNSTTDSTYAVSYFRTDDRILLTRDQGGNELDHVYVRTPDGQERDLTPGQELKAQFAGWVPDGSAFYLASNERDAKFFDIYRYDAKTYDRTLFFENKDGYFPSGISDDGRWMALTKLNTTNDSDLYLWNADTKAVVHLSPHKGNVNVSPATFDPASKFLYYVTDEGGEFARLRRYDLSAGRHEDVLKADWDIEFAAFSRTGRYRVTGINEDGRPRLSIVEAASGKAIPLPNVPSGGISVVVFAGSDSKLAFYVNGDRSPNNLYVLDLGSSKATRLTDSLSPDIDPQDLVDTQTVRVKARDGMTIPNVLWKPHQATPERKAPAIVWVHGGPGGQTTPGYNAVIQFLANHGYVVLGINNRGSSGYGKTFFAADDPSTGASRCGTAWTPSSTSRACPTSTHAASASSAAATGATWCWRRSRSSQTNSTSASTSSASPTGCARSKACRSGGRRSARRSTRRWATRQPIARCATTFRRCFTPTRFGSRCWCCRAPTIRASSRPSRTISLRR
jgi:dipeptidyl aminopeptidase/acylaminoacyl peptidase